MVRKLSAKDLKKFSKEHPDWMVQKQGKELVREVKISAFVDGIVLIARIGIHAEVLKHHPELTLTHHKLRIMLTTKDAKAITKLDTAFAIRIDTMLARTV